MHNFLIVGAIDPVATLVTCVIGAVCGFLAGQLLKGSGFGIVGNMVVGVIGAALFSVLTSSLHLIDVPFVNEIAGGTVGAVMLLLLIGMFEQVPN